MFESGTGSQRQFSPDWSRVSAATWKTLEECVSDGELMSSCFEAVERPAGVEQEASWRAVAKELTQQPSLANLSDEERDVLLRLLATFTSARYELHQRELMDEWDALPDTPAQCDRGRKGARACRRSNQARAMDNSRADVGRAIAVMALGAVALIVASGTFLCFESTELLGKELLFGSSCLIGVVGAGLLWLRPELRASPKPSEADVVDDKPDD